MSTEETGGAELAKRSVTIAGHRTSLALEGPFWVGLEQLAASQNLTLPKMIAAIDHDRGNAGLASAIRVAVLRHFAEK